MKNNVSLIRNLTAIVVLWASKVDDS